MTDQADSQFSQSDIEMIFDLYFEQIYRFFFYKFLSKSSAEDLTSDTFMEFISAVRKGKEINDPKSFLFGIAKHLFLAQLRKKYSFNSVSFDNVDWNFATYTEEFAEEIMVSNIDEVAAKYIKFLPDKQQEILRMRLIEKKTLSQIAELLGKDMNYVKTTQKRGIKKLKEIVACTP